MRLILKVITYKGLPLPVDITSEFDEQGGSIGRKPGNTMVLPDEDHFVSGRHAEIAYENGGFIIKDISTNGTLLLNSGIELKSNAAPLNSDEILQLGEYDISVEVVADQIAAFDHPFDQPFQPAASPTDPFAAPFQAEQPLPDDSFAPESHFQELKPLFSEHDPFAPAEQSRTDSIPFKEQAPSSPFQDSFAPPDVSATEPATPDISEFLKGLDALSSIDKPQPPAPAAEPIAESLPPEEPPTPIPTPAPPVQPQAAAAAAPEPEVTPATAPKEYDAALLAMFLSGAGISDRSFLPPERWPETMQSIGALFRSLVEGLMDVLRARAEMKSEFRVAVTTIRSFDNNPLKFNPDVESVLKLLMSPKNPAFIDADVAVRDAFKDIKFHQMAMTAGIQASLTEILYRFSPENFEKILGEGLVFQKKARCWELYCEKYPELKNLALEDFFGDQFAEAYEKQMLLLSKRQN